MKPFCPSRKVLKTRCRLPRHRRHCPQRREDVLAFVETVEIYKKAFSSSKTLSKMTRKFSRCRRHGPNRREDFLLIEDIVENDEKPFSTSKTTLKTMRRLSGLPSHRQQGREGFLVFHDTFQIDRHQERRIFRNEPGMHDLSNDFGKPSRFRRRSQLRIPHAVLTRFWKRTEIREQESVRQLASGAFLIRKRISGISAEWLHDFPNHISAQTRVRAQCPCATFSRLWPA